MLGYTGFISSEELDKYNAEKVKSIIIHRYCWKTGLEKEFEEYLAGEKGSEMLL